MAMCGGGEGELDIDASGFQVALIDVSVAGCVCHWVLGLLAIAWLASAGPLGAAVTHIVLNDTVTCVQIAVVLIVTHPLAHA